MQYRLAAIATLTAAVLSAQDAALHAPASCPVTKQSSTFVPPVPYEGAPEAGYFFIGTDGLWTKVPASGILITNKSADGYGTKQPWWSASYSRRNFDEWLHGEKPVLKITVRRLDGDTPAPRPSRGNFSWANGPFFMSGPTVPKPGCWEITGTLEGEQLSFVTWIAD